MTIDTSIYGQIQQQQAPSPIDAMQKAMSLKQMMMQNQAAQYQMQQQMAMRQAYADNTDPSGKINTAGAQAQVAKLGYGQTSLAMGQEFAAQQKAQAEAQGAQMDATHKIATVVLPIYKHLLDMPDEQARDAYHGSMESAYAQGVPGNNMPTEWDRAKIQAAYDQGSQFKEAYENQATQAGTEKTKKETGKIQSEVEKNYAEIDKIRAETGEKAINRNTDYQKMLNGDDIYKKSNDVIAAGNAASRLIEDAKTNSVSRSQLPFAIATMMNNGLPIRNAKEMDSFMEGLPPKDKTREMLSSLTTGKLDNDLADKLQQLITIKGGSAAQDKEDKINEISGQYSLATGLAPEEARRKLISAGSSGQGSGRMASKDKESGSGVPGVTSAQAGTKPTTAVEDKAAISWARNNMKDKRAQAILKHHGML